MNKISDTRIALDMLNDYVQRFPDAIERELRLGRLDFPKATSLANSAFGMADELRSRQRA